MNIQEISILKKGLCIYLIISGVSSLSYFIYNLGFLGMLISLWPSLVVILVSFIYIHSGYRGLKLGFEASGYTYQQIAFLIQGVSISILGVLFENSFGPMIGIGFTDTPDLDFVLNYRLFGIGLFNGYDKNSDKISVVFNLVPLFFCYLMSVKPKKIKTDRSDGDLLGSDF